jgi:nitroreductase
MDVLECIRGRRSVRAYRPDPVPMDLIEALVTGAVWAPSASNRQELIFIAVTAPDDMQRLRSFAPGMYGDPPVAIVIACDRSRLPDTPLGNQITDVVLMDAAMAAQNMLLGATDRGLGSCVIHSFRPTAVQHFLHLPEHIVPILLVALGYQAKVPPSPARRPLSDVLLWGRANFKHRGEMKNETEAKTVQVSGAGMSQRLDNKVRGLDSTLLVIHLLSSARGLLEEPHYYGPMRLLDTACRLIEFLNKHGLAEERVKRISEKLLNLKERGSEGYPLLAGVLDSAIADLSADL